MSTLPTPRTDAAAKQIGSIAARWKNRDIGAQLFSDLCEQQFYNLRSQERELTEAKAERDALGREREQTQETLRICRKDRDDYLHGLKEMHRLIGEPGFYSWQRVYQHIERQQADLSRWRALAEELAGALEGILDWGEYFPDWASDADRALAQKDWATARRVAAHFRDAANPASGAAITPVIHRTE